MAHQTMEADYASLPRTQPENYAQSPSFYWDESPYDDSALLSTLSSNSIDSSLGSPNSTLYSSIEQLNPRQELALSPLDHRFSWDELSAVNSGQLLTEMDTSDLHILPSISPEISVDQEIMPRRLDDRSVTFEESMVDEPQFQKPQVLPETDIAPSRDLFYNPLSWQRSQLSYRNGNCKLYSTLSPAEEARLRSIAMPAQPYPTSPVCSPPSPDSQRTRNRHNRTSSETSESDCLAPRSRHVINKKKAHSVTEKRYRTNLTDKITVLRDRIPSLRVIAKNNSVNEDLEGVSTTRKLNKGTILSEATEYIGHLERRTKDLTRENKFLKARIEAFELLAIAQCTPNYASPTVITGD